MTRFLPQRAAIDSFGSGGFRFAGMSHQGSLLVLPSGMRAWRPARITEAELDDLAAVVDEKDNIDFLLIGTGSEMVRPPAPLLAAAASGSINVDFMSTSSAVHVYNVVLAEGRRVAAALIAVGNADG